MKNKLIDTSNFDEAHARQEAAVAKYRSSGFGLMTTIISLSAGGIAGVISHESASNACALALFVPLLLSILQQLCFYMGERLVAESERHKTAFAMMIEMRGPDAPAEERVTVGKGTVPKSMAPMIVSWDAATKWFLWADRLCVAAVVTFLVMGLAILLNVS